MRFGYINIADGQCYYLHTRIQMKQILIYENIQARFGVTLGLHRQGKDVSDNFVHINVGFQVVFGYTERDRDREKELEILKFVIL